VHFGRTDDTVVEQLIHSVHQVKPDVVAVSGDLTQRARPREFERARAFLRSLPTPQIVVPGNHDVPLYNVYARFRDGFDVYRQYIADNLAPFYADGEIAIAGVNTARRLAFKGGRINGRQMLRVEEQLCGLPERVKKIVVTHHPFDLPPGHDPDHLAGRAGKALARFLRCGLDVLLAGHLHVSSSGPTAIRFGSGPRSAIFVQAGTACSTRGRGEPNSYNVIRLDASSIEIRTLSASIAGFEPSSIQRFDRSPSGWVRTEDKAISPKSDRTKRE
jgi:3',5'-cyclic AMP phosphodiesterase CpdA